MKTVQGEWKHQSWENCWYNIDPIQQKTFGCKCPEIINLEVYPEIRVGKGFEEIYDMHGGKSYALLYDRELFHKHPRSLEKILEISLREFGLTDILVKLKSGELTSKIEEEKIIERALAGCMHCKHYKPQI